MFSAAPQALIWLLLPTSKALRIFNIRPVHGVAERIADCVIAHQRIPRDRSEIAVRNKRILLLEPANRHLSIGSVDAVGLRCEITEFLSTAVGDEGGFAPALAGTEDALDSIMSAIKAAGYEPGKDVKIGMDCASSEFFKNGIYDYSIFEGENGKKRTADEQIAYLEDLINNYPIDSIEDGMSENDWEGWKKLTERIGNRCQLVGDDLFVTNVEFLEKGIAMGCANSILIKVNQIGSLSETLDAIEMAHRHGYTTVTSHRSGETEDATIADIAVATNSGQIKTGSLSRSDRMAKYNQLLRIEEELGNLAVYGYKRIK